MSGHHCQVGAIGLWLLVQIQAVTTHIKNGVFSTRILECWKAMILKDAEQGCTDFVKMIGQ